MSPEFIPLDDHHKDRKSSRNSRILANSESRINLILSGQTPAVGSNSHQEHLSSSSDKLDKGTFSTSDDKPSNKSLASTSIQSIHKSQDGSPSFSSNDMQDAPISALSTMPNATTTQCSLAQSEPSIQTVAKRPSPSWHSALDHFCSLRLSTFVLSLLAAFLSIWTLHPDAVFCSYFFIRLAIWWWYQPATSSANANSPNILDQLSAFQSTNPSHNRVPAPPSQAGLLNSILFKFLMSGCRISSLYQGSNLMGLLLVFEDMFIFAFGYLCILIIKDCSV